MKQLQNNFTTSEQSKRLLELGLPKGSADCWYKCYVEFGKPLIEGVVYSSLPEIGKNITTGDIPCWSVGRLMEIISICWSSSIPCYCNVVGEDNMTEYIIDTITHFFNHGMIDFSKLEE